MPKIIITPLINATNRLKQGLERYEQDTSDEQIRDGLIQRFEFTYELSHKTIKRYLGSTSANSDEFNTMSFGELIRTANERGLLKGNWSDWRLYREMRNLTSHTYNEDVALKVVADIPKFLAESEFLVNQLLILTEKTDE
ncbi:nucleotidyltransferase substrate binding protein [Faucicola mancuniensis]|uniref:nucleotidyltransferase substrate binding protein n=1 Tax=Faucicola mancuniensis TaxID=1309795 RepID=UPI00397725AF